ncbi:hypothetical protein [Microbacterium gorillae]|uniref:hypothetical protein n=1 Tax=Microbacterium gorillae TaxID=1231063 RepID=UPI00058C9734|nr:hypothetical protein [Microbacterium gorillae]
MSDPNQPRPDAPASATGPVTGAPSGMWPVAADSAPWTPTAAPSAAPDASRFAPGAPQVSAAAGESAPGTPAPQFAASQTFVPPAGSAPAPGRPVPDPGSVSQPYVADPGAPATSAMASPFDAATGRPPRAPRPAGEPVRLGPFPLREVVVVGLLLVSIVLSFVSLTPVMYRPPLLIGANGLLTAAGPALAISLLAVRRLSKPSLTMAGVTLERLVVIVGIGAVIGWLNVLVGVVGTIGLLVAVLVLLVWLVGPLVPALGLGPDPQLALPAGAVPLAVESPAAAPVVVQPESPVSGSLGVVPMPGTHAPHPRPDTPGLRATAEQPAREVPVPGPDAHIPESPLASADARTEPSVARDLPSEPGSAATAAPADAARLTGAGAVNDIFPSAALETLEHTETTGAAVLSGTYPVPSDSPAHEAFWALVPDERPVVDDGGRVLFTVGPTAWSLVIEDRGGSFLVRDADGRVGLLTDVTGVIRN